MAAILIQQQWQQAFGAIALDMWNSSHLQLGKSHRGIPIPL